MRDCIKYNLDCDQETWRTYEIFAIRLQVLTAQWRDATDSNHQAIVRARILDILEPVMHQRVNTQFGHETMAVELRQWPASSRELLTLCPTWRPYSTIRRSLRQLPSHQ